MSVRPQTLPIHPSLSDGICSLLLRQTHHFRDYRGRRDLDQYNVIQPNFVERIFQCQTPLDLMRFDHALQDIFNLENFSTA